MLCGIKGCVFLWRMSDRLGSNMCVCVCVWYHTMCIILCMRFSLLTLMVDYQGEVHFFLCGCMFARVDAMPSHTFGSRRVIRFYMRAEHGAYFLMVVCEAWVRSRCNVFGKPNRHRQCKAVCVCGFWNSLNTIKGSVHFTVVKGLSFIILWPFLFTFIHLHTYLL